MEAVAWRVPGAKPRLPGPEPEGISRSRAADPGREGHHGAV